MKKFVQKVKAENVLVWDEDIFLHWDAIKEEYIEADAVREREKNRIKRKRFEYTYTSKTYYDYTPPLTLAWTRVGH